MDCNSKEPMLGFSPELFEERRKTVFSKLDNSNTKEHIYTRSVNLTFKQKASFSSWLRH